MTALTISAARSLGAGHSTLHLNVGPYTLTLRPIAGASGCKDMLGISAHTRIEQICSVLTDMRPIVNERCIQSRGAFVYFAPEHAPLIAAWLDGYYESPTTRSTK